VRTSTIRQMSTLIDHAAELLHQLDGVTPVDQCVDDAAGVLQAVVGRSSVSVLEVLEYLALVAQTEKDIGPFGNPGVTLARSRWWRFDALVWDHPASTIHSHDSVGAFYSLYGSRVERAYTFDFGGTFRGVVWGDINGRRAKLISPGEVNAFGLGFIHQVCWLDKPSVSLVVRRLADDRSLAREYWPSGIERAAAVDRSERAILGALDALVRFDSRKATETLLEMARSGHGSDLLSALEYCSARAPRLVSQLLTIAEAPPAMNSRLTEAAAWLRARSQTLNLASREARTGGLSRKVVLDLLSASQADGAASDSWIAWP
jgi:hypothetical protein